MARELFDQALPHDERLARESRVYRQDYARKSWHDPAKRNAVVAVFGNSYAALPP